MKVKIIAKEALPIAEVNDILVKLEKKGELSGSQQRIRDFTAKFNKTVYDAAWAAVKKKAPKEGAKLEKLLMK